MIGRFLLLFLVVNLSLNAQSAKEITQKAHLANINALLIFTSQEGLSSGSYSFTNAGVDMEVYHLPITYHFDSQDSALNYFIVGNVGYSRVFISQQIDIPSGYRLNYDNHLRTYIAGIGGGIRYKVSEDFHLSTGLELIYSRSGASVVEPNDNIGDAIEDFFNKSYNDNISYKFFAIAEYNPIIKKFKPYVKLSYKLYETKSTFTLDELAAFETQSSVTTLALGVETPELFYYNNNYLTLEAYINGNHLDGAVEKSVKFNRYNTLGAVAYWYTEDKISWIERFFLEISTVDGDGLEGYNVGVGFSVDY